MPACELTPTDKKKYIGEVGQRLVKRHGKKKHYRPEEVRRASLDAGYPIDYVCWAYTVFTTPADFEALHAAAGEVCNYLEMKAEVLRELGQGAFELPDLDLSWLEWPDIDLSGLFDWWN
jgi:hypothetical protein